jgi:RNA polymerase sigma-70 factor (ECF subfamily)
MDSRSDSNVLRTSDLDVREEVLSRLFSEYRSRLKRMVEYRMDARLTGRVDASDVLQEAYIDAVRRVGHFVDSDESVSLYLWLRQITEQSMIDIHRRHLRAKKRDVRRDISIDRDRSSRLNGSGSGFRLASNHTSPSIRAIRFEQETAIDVALTMLSPRDREVIELRHFEELSNNQVADVLNLSATAACNRYVRAIKRLKELLDTAEEVIEDGQR